MTFNPTRPVVLLRLEGAAVLALAILFYRELGGGWGFFVALFLVPDISLLAYLGGARVGAVVYNAVHTYLVPALLYAYGFAAARPTLMLVALIWGAHIGVDRLLGFGLKFQTSFKHTHLKSSEE